MCVFSIALLEMARKHSKVGKKRTHRQRKYKGGGWGFTGPSSIPGTPGTVSNPQVFTGIGDCRAVKPGYDIPYSDYSSYYKGLPGMSGGRRRSRKGSKGKTRKQRGGRYGFFPEAIDGVAPSGAAWWAGTYPPVQRIGCEGSTPNPLNPGPHTPSTNPPGAASANYYLNAAKGLMSGGGSQLAPATYGVGNVDSMYYYAPTAGYANTASTWKDSVGAPVQIQVPFAARSMNQACLTTGGHPPLTGALQTGGKRTRKNRKGGGFTIPGLGITLPTSVANFQGVLGEARRRVGGIFGLGGEEAAVANTGVAATTNTGLTAGNTNAVVATVNNTNTTANTTSNTNTNNNRNNNRKNNNKNKNNTSNKNKNNSASQMTIGVPASSVNNNNNYQTPYSNNNNNINLTPPTPPSTPSTPNTPPNQPQSPLYEPQTPPYVPATPTYEPQTPPYGPESPEPQTPPYGAPTPPSSPSYGGKSKRKSRKSASKKKV